MHRCIFYALKFTPHKKCFFIYSVKNKYILKRCRKRTFSIQKASNKDEVLLSVLLLAGCGIKIKTKIMQAKKTGLPYRNFKAAHRKKALEQQCAGSKNMR